MASETSTLVVAGIVDHICGSVVSRVKDQQRGRVESKLVVDDLLRSLLDKCLNLVDKGVEDQEPVGPPVVRSDFSLPDSGSNVESDHEVQRQSFHLLPESSGALIPSPSHSLDEPFDEAVCIEINHEEPINPDEHDEVEDGEETDNDGRGSRFSAESREADECIEVDIEQDESSIQIIEVEDNVSKSDDKKNGEEVAITEREGREVDDGDNNDVEDKTEDASGSGDVGGKKNVGNKNEDFEMNEDVANRKEKVKTNQKDVRKQVVVEVNEDDDGEVVEENKEEYGVQEDAGDVGKDVEVSGHVAHNGEDRSAKPIETLENDVESCGIDSFNKNDTAADQFVADERVYITSSEACSKDMRGERSISVMEVETAQVSTGDERKDKGQKMATKNFSKQRILQDSSEKGKLILRSSLPKSKINTKRLDRLNNNDEKISSRNEQSSFRCFACTQYALVIFQSSYNLYRHVRRMHKLDLVEYVEKYSSSDHFLECRLCGADDVRQSVKSIEAHLKQLHPKSSFEDFFGIKKVDKTEAIGKEIVRAESKRPQMDDSRSEEELSNRQAQVISPISKSVEFNFEEEYSKSSLKTESRHHFRCQICQAFKSFVLKDARTHMDRVHGRGQWSKIAFSVQRLHKCLVCDQFVQVEEAEFTNHLKGHVCSWQDYLQLNSAQPPLLEKIGASQHANINVNWKSVDANGGIPHLNFKSIRPPPAVLQLIAPKVNGSVTVSKEASLSTNLNTTRTETATISTPNSVPTTALASTPSVVETTSSMPLPTSVVSRLSTLPSASATQTKSDLQTLTCVDPPVKIHSSLLKGAVQRSSTIGNHCTFACLVPRCRAQSASFSAICQHSQVAHNSPRLVPQVTQLTLHKCILCQQDVMCDTAIIVKHVLRHEVSVVDYKAQLEEINKEQDKSKEQGKINRHQEIRDREQGIAKEQTKSLRQQKIQVDVHEDSKGESRRNRQQKIQEEQGTRQVQKATDISTQENGKSPESNIQSNRGDKASKRKDEERSQLNKDRERKVARKLPQHLSAEKRCDSKLKQEKAVEQKLKSLADKSVPPSKTSKPYKSIIRTIHTEKNVAQSPQKTTKKTDATLASAPSTSTAHEEPRLPSKVTKFEVGSSEVAPASNCSGYRCVFCNKAGLNVNAMKRHLVKAHHVPTTMGLLDNVLEKCKPKSGTPAPNNSIASKSATTSEEESRSAGVSFENGSKSGSQSLEKCSKTSLKGIPKGDEPGQNDVSKKVTSKPKVDVNTKAASPNEVNTYEKKTNEITWHECAVCGARVRNSVPHIKRHLSGIHDLPLSTYLRRMALKRRASNESEDATETSSRETKTRRKQSLSEVKKEIEDSDDIVVMYESNPVSDKRS